MAHLLLAGPSYRHEAMHFEVQTLAVLRKSPTPEKYLLDSEIREQPLLGSSRLEAKARKKYVS